MTEPTTPLLGTPAPRASAPPKVTFTAAQLLADNLATRAREIAAIFAMLMLAKWSLVPGGYVLGAIVALVLPIELTRQLVKPAVAKLSGGAAAAIVGLVTLHKVATYGAVSVALAAALTGCTVTQGHQAGTAFGAVDKVMTWVCGAWGGIRSGARTLLPSDAADGSDAGAPAPASSGGAQ